MPVPDVPPRASTCGTRAISTCLHVPPRVVHVPSPVVHVPRGTVPEGCLTALCPGGCLTALCPGPSRHCARGVPHGTVPRPGVPHGTVPRALVGALCPMGVPWEDPPSDSRVTRGVTEFIVHARGAFHPPGSTLNPLNPGRYGVHGVERPLRGPLCGVGMCSHPGVFFIFESESAGYSHCILQIDFSETHPTDSPTSFLS